MYIYIHKPAERKKQTKQTNRVAAGDHANPGPPACVSYITEPLLLTVTQTSLVSIPSPALIIGDQNT